MFTSLLAFISTASALSGIYGPTVSTWDTRASSVVFSGSKLLLPNGQLQALTYSTNFSSTTASLSSQLGLHYINYTDSAWREPLHGASGTATTMFVIPLMPRFDNGMPKLALDLYGSLAPAVLLNTSRYYLSLPLAMGAGVPIAPTPWLTLTPWGELAPSLDFGTVISTYTIAVEPGDTEYELSAEQIDELLAEAVEWELSPSLAWRAGLSASAHIGRFDVNLLCGAARISGQEESAIGLSLGGSVTLHWDAVVPSVLPAEPPAP